MSDTKSNSTINPGVEKLLQTVRSELYSFFRHDSNHWHTGRLAHVYFEPVMRGQSRYEDRELLTIKAGNELHRVRAANRFSSELTLRGEASHILERTDLEVHVGLRNPQNPFAGKHVLVASVGDAFAEFLKASAWMIENACDEEVSPAENVPPRPALSVTMILSTSAGPMAILIGDSHCGQLTEDRQALMHARILNAGLCLNQ